jgi:hypothetical protein
MHVVLGILIVSLVAAPGFGGEVFNEDFASGSLPPDFVVTDGDVTVADAGGDHGTAMIMSSHACVELPGTFDRKSGLVFEADVNITWGAARNFDVNALCDTLGGPSNDQPANDGYRV